MLNPNILMRKAFLLLLSIVFSGIVAGAQENSVRFSINVGPQWNSKIGASLGADANIPFGCSRWSFEPGVYWSFRNATYDYSHNQTKEEYNDKLHYLNVPLRFAACIAGSEGGAFNMSILFGPYFAYGLSGNSHCMVTEDGIVTKYKVGAFSDEGRLESRFDYGLNFGIAAIVKQHVKIGAFTEIGLKNIYKPQSFFDDILGDLVGVTKINIGAGISVGYQF